MSGTPRALMFTALEGGNLVAGFLLQPMLMRALGPPGYGTYAWASAWGVIAVTLTDFGLNVAAVAPTLARRGDAAALRQHFWSVQWVKAGAGLLAVGAAGAVAFGGHPDGGMLLWAAACGALAAWACPGWYLLAHDAALRMGATLVAVRVAGVGFALTLLPELPGPAQLPCALALTLAPPLLAGLLLWGWEPALRPVRRPCRPGRDLLLRDVHAGAQALPVTLQGVASAALMATLLLQQAGAAVLGAFSAADRVRAGLQGLFSAFSMALFPRMFGAAPRRRAALLGLQLGAAALLAAALAVAHGPVMAFVGGRGYETAGLTLEVLAASLVTATAVQVLGLQWLVPAGRTRHYLAGLVLLLALQAAGLWIAGPRLDAPGAAWVVVGSEAVVGALLLVLARRARP